MAMPESQANRLLPLREELILHRGPANWDGSPSWTLEDPLRGRFFRLGWLEMALLSRWSVGDRQRLIADVNRQMPLEINEADVDGFSHFLQQHALTRADGDAALRDFMRQKTQARHVWWRWLLHNYLFLRIPLFHPHRGLQRMLPWVAFFYRRPFWLATLAAGISGLVFASRQWQTFLHTFLHFFTLEGALLAGATLVFTKCLHELGHAFTCTRYGARVSTLGVAFLVLMPVLYTDTSASWKLPRRQPRLAIGAAGMLVELALAAWATLAWSFLPDGMWRSAAFMLATTTWIMTLLINLSPLMRFDGYFLLSDVLGVPNLQPRAFALARWKLREWLFGLGSPPPECWPRWLQRTLLAYSFATWVYRLFLFTGIALLVYHMAFKLLGMLLFAVEIGWFVLLPVWNELREWTKRRKDYRMNRHLTITLCAVTLALSALLLPWQRTVYAPALLRADQQHSFYMPLAGRVQQMAVQPGDAVKQGQILFTLQADSEAHQRQQLALQLKTLAWQQEYQLLNHRAAQEHQRIRQEREAASQRYQVLDQQQQALLVRAPFDGVMADLMTPLSAGDWLAQGEWLGTLTGPRGGLVEALVSEQDWRRLRAGDSGTFYPRDASRAGVAVTVTDIERTALHDMRPLAELASLYGGPVATLNDRQQKLPPEQAVYRVVLAVAPDSAAPAQVLTGTVTLQGEAQSPLARLWQRVRAVLIRELSF
ncbi:HlyD family efflux transporter periplasmic adaptor subunit [Dickeya chrysanthemi]|uniref:HlyD family efflux transporter periplasmic adaptor subunit n=1 Tax=Dickeya chrysanthemi TaxID=556 RepID=UPI0003A8025D|nr:HlyD family efflux transporter periplasmic adaptor subunit [Dickeya chrysanthemi]MBX9447293.1 HlyD family efflux transporter periplasmic adaptor subunit [Dickeya chrysanthemi]